MGLRDGHIRKKGQWTPAPFVPALLGKLHQRPGVKVARAPRPGFWKWRVSLATSSRGDVLFALPGFISSWLLASPKSLREQLPANNKY